MPFLNQGLYLDRGKYNSGVSETSYAKHRYKTADAFTAVESAGYFPDYLGANVEDVNVDDFILVQDATLAEQTYLITAVSPMALTLIPVAIVDGDDVSFGEVTTTTGITLPTPGGTPTLLFYYESAGATLTVGNALPASTVDAFFIRLNNEVTCHVLSHTGTAVGGSATIELSGIPARFEPLLTAELSAGISISSSGATEVGLANIAAGNQDTIFVNKLGGNYAANSGFFGFTMKWLVV